MEAQEGGGVTFRVMPVERESVILRDLPAQGFMAGDGFGFLAHTPDMSRAREQPPRGFLARRRASVPLCRLKRPGSR
jgi:hypothetical protein